jgi:hypothetical protein
MLQILVFLAMPVNQPGIRLLQLGFCPGGLHNRGTIEAP